MRNRLIMLLMARYHNTKHTCHYGYLSVSQADAAGIDSVVMDMEFKQRPERYYYNNDCQHNKPNKTNRLQQLRIIESTAPCTMPPFVAATWVSQVARKVIARTLARMHEDEETRELMRENGFSRFTLVNDKDYDSVRLVRKMYHHN